MNESTRRWLPAAIVAGLVYFAIGRVFTAQVEPVRLWRMLSWGLSGGVFGLHIAYEHVRVRATPRAVALHAAAAVALGAFLLALVAWPLLTAVPAFLVAWAVAWVLARRAPATPASGAIR